MYNLSLESDKAILDIFWFMNIYLTTDGTLRLLISRTLTPWYPSATYNAVAASLATDISVSYSDKLACIVLQFSNVEVGVIVGVGVTVLVGVIDGVLVIVGVKLIVGLRLGVMLGVTEIVGVTGGVFVGVNVGVIVTVGVGVGVGT